MKDTECDAGDRGEREIEGSVWQKETREDSKEIGGREIRWIGEAKKREKEESGRRKEICEEWQREIGGSGETEIEIAGHEGKEHKGR